MVWGLISAGVVASVVSARGLTIGKADEWVLRVRNGKLVRSGIGIVTFCWPWESLVRFTSTTQRVRFSCAGLSKDHVGVELEAFLLWSVSPNDGGPLEAFSKLGIVNRASRSRREQSEKHLLSRPQHHAFQQMLAAASQRTVAKHRLRDLLANQDTFLAELGQTLSPRLDALGVKVDDLQLLRVAASEAEVRDMLSAEEIQAIRAESEAIRIATDDKIATDELHRDAERERIRAEQADLMRRKSDENEAAALLRRLEREAKERVAEMEAVRERASNDADAIRTLAAAESVKSEELRQYELSRASIEASEKLAAHVNIGDASWVTVGEDNPISSLLGLAKTAIGGANKAAT